MDVKELQGRIYTELVTVNAGTLLSSGKGARSLAGQPQNTEERRAMLLTKCAELAVEAASVFDGVVNAAASVVEENHGDTGSTGQ